MVYSKRWGHIAAILMLGLSVLCSPARSQQFSTPKNVSNNADYSFTPQIAVDAAGNIYMAWEDDTANNSNILFSRSTDGGVTFLQTPAAKQVSNSLGCSFSPVMAVDAPTDLITGVKIGQGDWPHRVPGELASQRRTCDPGDDVADSESQLGI